ncbi:hypothetical protein N7478_011947 [Penicillium angulare]|uniref:uncharacterized protein n=1 Tax=Penicillium angulare TaxID=116970 RepID=UPI0025414B54|nr:uncharacterized protein N7478_011947 [Penicillium angulare]KAJ5261352.1 hypothetical protein N7478_011947 [Penicillium angulare]
MDPVSAFGLFASAIQVLQAVASTASGLRELAEKLQGASFSIHCLIQELCCIKAALTSLKEWLRIHRSGDHGQQFAVLDADLAVAIDGCHGVMQALHEEVFDLVQNVEETGTFGFTTKMKVVWKDATIRSHKERLQDHVRALQILVNACQCHSLAEQNELLRRATTRQLIEKVASDAATLRSVGLSRAPSEVDDMSESSSRVALSNRTLDFNETLIHTPVYQRALSQWPASTVNLDREPSISPRQPEISITQSPSVDEGYDSFHSGSAGWSPPPVPGFGQPFNLLPIPNTPPIPTHSRSFSQTQIPQRPSPVGIRRNASDSKVLPQRQPSSSWKNKISNSLGRINTKSRMSLRSTSAKSPSSAVSPNTRERWHRFRSNLLTSIDIARSSSPVSIFIRAAQSGTLEEVEGLIERGCDIEERHAESGRNALLVAAHCGREDIVDLLISRGARINVKDGSGETALHLAASRGHWEVIGILMEEKRLIETPNLKGRTALRVAAECGERESVQILLDNNAQVNVRAENEMTALHAVAKRGNSEILQLLVEYGADTQANDGFMMTPLHYACLEGHLEAVKALLIRNADIEAQGRDRKTPLICAAEAGKTQVVEYLLLKKKASLRSVDDSGRTALHWAAHNGHENAVRLLSDRRGSLDMIDSEGLTALHLAVMQSQYPVVDFFLQRRGAPLDKRCNRGRTALHFACLANSHMITRRLLLSGADIEAPESEHAARALHISAAQGSMQLLDLLCEKGANLSARNGVGDRPLCVASRSGNAEAVQRLLDHGSPLTCKFDSGSREDSPLCLAAMGGHWEAAAVLLRNGASALKKDEAGWQPIRYAAYHGHHDVLELLLTSTNFSDPVKPEVIRMSEKLGFSTDVPLSTQNRIQDLLQRSYPVASSARPQPPISPGTPVVTRSQPPVIVQPPSIPATFEGEAQQIWSTEGQVDINWPGRMYDQYSSAHNRGPVSTSAAMAPDGYNPPGRYSVISDIVPATVESGGGPLYEMHDSSPVELPTSFNTGSTPSENNNRQTSTMPFHPRTIFPDIDSVLSS